MLILGWIIIWFIRCPEEVDPTYSIFLSVEETSCQSISLHLTIPKVSDSQRFMIKRNGMEITRGTIIEEDTLISDDSLSVNTPYRYRAYIMSGNSVKDSSEEIATMTMDTTSSDFVWDIDTIGVNISDFYDVSIINENNIWAVGEISTGKWDSLIIDADTFLTPINYNAAKWNGSNWEMIRICPPMQPATYPHRALYIFSPENIWSCTSAGYHYNGLEWTVYGSRNSTWNFNGYVQSIWGNSSSDIYFVGDSGSIVYYDGTTFTKMNSGTDLLLRDIAGSGRHVFVIGWNYSGESGILSLENGQWQILYEEDNPKQGYYTAVDVYGDIAYFITNTGILRYNFQKKVFIFEEVKPIKNWTYRYIEVQNTNDILLLSGDGRILHFNGIHWKEIRELDYDHTSALFYQGNLAFKNNLAVVAGELYTDGWRARAMVARGTRY